MTSSIFDPLWRPVPPLRRGGWRQRLLDNSADTEVQPSRTVLRFLEDWGRGSISAIQLWRHIDDMKQDGFSHPAITKLHSIAAHCEDGNAAKNLVDLLVDALQLNTLITEIPGCSVSHVVKPSAMFAWLHRFNRPLWSVRFGADAAAITSFWENLFSSAQGGAAEGGPSFFKRSLSVRAIAHHTVLLVGGCGTLLKEK